MDAASVGWGIFTHTSLLWIKACVAGIAAVFFLYFFVKPENQDSRVSVSMLTVIGLSAAFLWGGKVTLNLKEYVHLHDFYHYYMGAKYFKELGYTGLYEATVIADLENGHKKEVLARNEIRDLRTNKLIAVKKVLEDKEQIKARFTQQRWESYRADVEYFRIWSYSRLTNVWLWKSIHKDHGFNATPVWSIAGILLTNLGPAGKSLIFFLTLLDFLIIGIMWAVVFRVFNWKAGCAALVWWGTNLPGEFAWTSASLLRYDWLLFLVLAIAFLKKEKPGAAGASVAIAAMLRVFPGILALGVIFLGVHELIRERKTPVWLIRFTAGGIAACIILMPAATLIGQRGVGVWQEFAKNSQQHLSNPLENTMGLKPLISYMPKTKAGQGWGEDRIDAFKRRSPAFYLIIAGFLCLLLITVKNKPVHYAAILSVGAVFFCFNISCYYFSMFLVWGFLFEEQPGLIAVSLCALSMATNIVALFVSGFAEIYFFVNLMTLCFILFAFIFCGYNQEHITASPCNSSINKTH